MKGDRRELKLSRFPISVGTVKHDGHDREAGGNCKMNEAFFEREKFRRPTSCSLGHDPNTKLVLFDDRPSARKCLHRAIAIASIDQKMPRERSKNPKDRNANHFLFEDAAPAIGTKPNTQEHIDAGVVVPHVDRGHRSVESLAMVNHRRDARNPSDGVADGLSEEVTNIDASNAPREKRNEREDDKGRPHGKDNETEHETEKGDDGAQEFLRRGVYVRKRTSTTISRSPCWSKRRHVP